jgi:hypothetical protein
MPRIFCGRSRNADQPRRPCWREVRDDRPSIAYGQRSRGIIASVIGRPVVHNDIDPAVWINGAVETGFVPADYGILLR